MDTLVETVKTLVTMLNTLTPLGLAAGLAFIIYHLTAKHGNIRLISENHLSGLPEDSARLERIETQNDRIEAQNAAMLAILNQILGRLS